MALVKQRYADYEGGAVTVYVTYDDLLMLVTEFSCVNNGKFGIKATLTDPATGKATILTTGAGKTDVVAIPTTGVDKLSTITTVRDKGKFPSGLRFEGVYPWP